MEQFGSCEKACHQSNISKFVLFELYSSFREWRDPQTSVTTNTTLNMEEQSLISGIRVNRESLSLGSRDSVKSRGTRTPFLPAS